MQQTIFGTIPNHWQVSNIKSETSIVTDYVANGSFASLAENVEYKTKEDYAVLIRLVDFNNQFKGDFVFIDEHAYNFLAKSHLFGDEIIISNVGANVGTVFKCPHLKYKMALAPNSIMVKFDGVNDFYYYWLTSPAGQGMLQSIVTGSAQPKFNKTNFKLMPIPVPPLSEQKKISAILSSLDDKIETNRKINARLEELAAGLFKSWFIDFEPFGGEMPGDWEVKSLSDIARYLNGLAMQKYPPTCSFDKLPVLKIKELGEGLFSDKSDYCSASNIPCEYIINRGDIIFSWSGTLLVKMWTGGQCGLNQHLFKVSSKEYPKWYYYLWTKYHNDNFQRIAKDKAVTMGHIKREELDKAKVAVPTKEIMNKIDSMINPILDCILSINLESALLAELRDALLPKLMSGEIKVE